MLSTFHQFFCENTGQLSAAAGDSLELHLSAALQDRSKQRMEKRKAGSWQRAGTELWEWEGPRIVVWDPFWEGASCFEVEEDLSCHLRHSDSEI